MAGEEEPVRETVPGAGVGPGSGGNRVRFQEMVEKDGVAANKRGVGWRLQVLHRWGRVPKWKI